MADPTYTAEWLDKTAKEIEDYTETKGEVQEKLAATTDAAKQEAAEEINHKTHEKIGKIADLYFRIEKAASNKEGGIHTALSELLTQHNEKLPESEHVTFTKKLDDDPYQKLVKLVNARISDKKKALVPQEVGRWSKVIGYAKDNKWTAKDIPKKLQESIIYVDYVEENGERKAVQRKGVQAIVKAVTAKNEVLKAGVQGEADWHFGDWIKKHNEIKEGAKETKSLVNETKKYSRQQELMEIVTSTAFDAQKFVDNAPKGRHVIVLHIGENNEIGGTNIELTSEELFAALDRKFPKVQPAKKPKAAKEKAVKKERGPVLNDHYAGPYNYLWRAIELCRYWNPKSKVLVSVGRTQVVVTHLYQGYDHNQLLCHTKFPRTTDTLLDKLPESFSFYIQPDTNLKVGEHFAINKKSDSRYDIECADGVITLLATADDYAELKGNVEVVSPRVLSNIEVVATSMAHAETSANITGKNKATTVRAAITPTHVYYWHGEASQNLASSVGVQKVGNRYNEKPEDTATDAIGYYYINLSVAFAKTLYKKADKLYQETYKDENKGLIKAVDIIDYFVAGNDSFLQTIVGLLPIEGSEPWQQIGMIGVKHKFDDVDFMVFAIGHKAGNVSAGLKSIDVSKNQTDEAVEPSEDKQTTSVGLPEVKELERVPVDDVDVSGIDEI